MKVPWEIEVVKIAASKHFALKYLKKWGWDFHDLRDAIRDAYYITRVGERKYEIFIQKKGFKKIISVYYVIEDELFCITGSEGGKHEMPQL